MSNIRKVIEHELHNMWKEAVVAYFELIKQQFPEVTEGNFRYLDQGIQS